MTSVSLSADPSFLQKYPAQLSVGQAQRVLIAMAVMPPSGLCWWRTRRPARWTSSRQSEILELFASVEPARSACRFSTFRTICRRSPESASVFANSSRRPDRRVRTQGADILSAHSLLYSPLDGIPARVYQFSIHLPDLSSRFLSKGSGGLDYREGTAFSAVPLSRLD